MKNFVEAKWLKENIDNEETVIIDVRYDLHDREYGKATYAKGHIPGAHYLDIDGDLAGEKKTTGGSRPVPEAHVFVEKIQKMGVKNDTTVILYDENMITASRAFWMFRYIGHENVKIVDGGYRAWVDAGGDVTSEVPVCKKTDYKMEVKEDIFCEIETVKEYTRDQHSILVECRSHERYLGNNEPFYHKAGHIPTAVCIDSKSLLKDGKLRPVEELKKIMGRLSDYEEVVFYCGSGINAALDYVVYDELGQGSKIYIGGFSDWISYDENYVETVDEN